VNPWRECECECECQCEWRGRLVCCVYFGPSVGRDSLAILLSYTGGFGISRPQGLPNHPCQSSWLPPNKAKLTPSNYAARTHLHTLLPCLYITPANTIPRLHLGTYLLTSAPSIQFNSTQPNNPHSLTFFKGTLRSLSHSETSLSHPQQFIPVS